MNRKLTILIVMALLVLVFPVSTAFALGATNQTWTSSITYYTPSTTDGNLSVDYFAADGTKYSAPAIALLAHKAGSLFIGNVSQVPASFAGSSVLSSDVTLVATYVQFAAGSETGNYGRMLYSGFSAADAAAKFYVPTVLYQKFGSTSRIGVQNIEDFAVAAALNFYAVGSTTATATKNVVIPALSSYIFTPADISGLAPGFNGSLVITGAKSDTPATPGRVVAASEETSDAGRSAYAFEGVAQGANKIFMASMLCDSGAALQRSFYAIQNAGTADAQVTITAYNTSGAVVGTMAATTIAAGGKLSKNPCDFGVPAGTSGSAVIESTGAPVIAIGKVLASNGLATAFNGATAGGQKVAAPYVRWAPDPSTDFRSFIAIMNVGAAEASDIKVNYYNGAGALAATQVLATSSNKLGQYVKRNSDASSAGALTSGSFGFSPSGGAIEVVSDQPVVVVVRSLKNVSPPLGAITQFGEDYNGTSVP